MTGNVDRLVTVVLTTRRFESAVRFYADAIGLEMHIDDHKGDDPWTSGRHAAASWTDGAFIHFAIYEAKSDFETTGAQVAFRVADLSVAHQRATAAGATVIHPPHPQPWGTSARYRDPDGNVVELTQAG